MINANKIKLFIDVSMYIQTIKTFNAYVEYVQYEYTDHTRWIEHEWSSVNKKRIVDFMSYVYSCSKERVAMYGV